MEAGTTGDRHTKWRGSTTSTVDDSHRCSHNTPGPAARTRTCSTASAAATRNPSPATTGACEANSHRTADTHRPCSAAPPDTTRARTRDSSNHAGTGCVRTCDTPAASRDAAYTPHHRSQSAFANPHGNTTSPTAKTPAIANTDAENNARS